MQVIVQQLLTQYQISGSGKRTILFLHGWADNADTFSVLVKALSEDLKNTKFICLNLPGFGGTQAPPEAWGLAEYAEFVQAFLMKIDHQPQVIVGHSNGGAIAIKGLATGKLNADKLVLLASAGVRIPSLKKTLLRLASKPLKISMSVLPKNARKKLRQKLYTSIGSDYLIAEHMQATFVKVVSQDVTNEAKQVLVPTLLIYGDEDTSTPESYGRILSDNLPNSILQTIPQTGHFVHQEQVYKVASLIKGFLKK